MADRHLEHKASGSQDVAIIGMACIFPKAPNLQTFWQNIVSKIDAISDPPADGMIARVYDPASTANNRIYCKRGGYLQDLPPFNPADFGIMPVALDGAEPEHFMALKVAYDALVDAGFPDKPFNRERTGVILGRGTFVNRAYVSMLQHVLVVDQTIDILKELHPEYTPEELEAIRTRLTTDLPPFTPDTAPGLPHSVMAGIIANRLNLRGPTMVLDAACASCLLALEMGMRDLLTGKCDVSVIGGVQISTAAPIHMLFTQLGALSHLSHLRPFDRQADGTMLGEGIGMMVLKRTKDAIKDGHRIYALVKGVGASSDGKGKGLLAPQVEGEELALRRAYEAAGVSPDSIGLIEAHGTALPLGDLTEIEALRRVFGLRDGGPPRVALGTVKSMIGHLIPAAGIAGLIKGALSLYHKILPPTLNVEEPDPRLEIENTPFYLNTATRPWVHGVPHLPRRAGVNSFGFGGINTHAVLEEYSSHTDELAFQHRTWENELIVIEGASRPELISRCEATLELLVQLSGVELVDIAYTLNRRLQGQPFRLAIVAESRENLRRKLEHALKKLKDPNRSRIKDRSGIYFFENPLGRQGKLAYLFPGEGSQYVNMLQDLCLHFPEVRECFDLLDRAFAGHPRNYLPSQIIFPPTEPAAAAAGEKIWQIDGAVDAVITADRALFRLLGLLGLAPQGIVGHSSGELMALEAASAVAFAGDEELVQLIKAGNRMLEALTAAQDIPEGVLLAVGGVERQAVDAAIEAASEFLVLAMDNCPHQFVLCGTETSIAEARARFAEQGGICQTLPFKRAYHTERFEPVLKPLRDYFQQATVTSPAVLLYSCMTAGPFPPEPEAIRRYAEQQWARPVRFRETIAAMYDQGFRLFVEVGPRSNLTGFVNDILQGREFLAVATNVHHRSGITQLLHALGLLATQGVNLDLGILYKHRAPRLVDEQMATEGQRSPGVILSRELPILSLETIETLPHPEKTAPLAAPPAVAPAVCQAGGCAASSIPSPESLAADPGVKLAEKSQAATAMANPSARPPVQAVMQEYLATMEDFLASQEQVMLAYMQRGAGPQAVREISPASGQPAAASHIAAEPVSEIEPAAVKAAGPEPTALGAGAQPAGENLASTLLAIISDKTGYPLDMLNEHQDLEADLGIDSIKRVEILGMLAQQLGSTAVSTEDLGSLKTVAEIVAFLSQPQEIPTSREPETAPLTVDTPELPPVLRSGGSLTHLVPHRGVRVRRRLDVAEDLFLQDHTLGGQVSQTHPELLALPVVPLSMSLEMMAATASLLTPLPCLVGLKDIRVRDWLAVTEGHLDLDLSAQVQTASPTTIAVQLRTLTADPSANPAPAVEGTMIFDEAYGTAPAAGAWQPGEKVTSVPAPEEFYPQALFHGSRFRSVQEIRQAGAAGLEAVLETPAAGPFFQDFSTPGFLTNPVLLDGAGQVVGLWAQACLEETFVIFPAQLTEVSFYGPPETLATPVLCRVSPRLDGDLRIVSDIQLLSPDGKLVAQLRGLQHQRARLPKILHLFRGSRQISLSRPWPTPLPDLVPTDKVACNRLDPLPVDWHGPDSRIWLEVLAHIALSPEERQIWRQFSGSDKRRQEWLLARVTGKEAVRRLLQEGYGFDAWLADIEIYPDQQGKPLVRGAWLNRLKAAPALSLSHSHSLAVALVADGAALTGVGLDIELLHRPGKGFPDMAFAPEEQQLLPPPEALEFAEWCLRCWCAKEAVAKALGRGLLNGLRDLQVVEINRPQGEIRVGLVPKLAQDYPLLAGNAVQAYTAREENVIVASSFIGKASENPETVPEACRQINKVNFKKVR